MPVPLSPPQRPSNSHRVRPTRPALAGNRDWLQTGRLVPVPLSCITRSDRFPPRVSPHSAPPTPTPPAQLTHAARGKPGLAQNRTFGACPAFLHHPLRSLSPRVSPTAPLQLPPRPAQLTHAARRKPGLAQNRTFGACPAFLHHPLRSLSPTRLPPQRPSNSHSRPPNSPMPLAGNRDWLKTGRLVPVPLSCITRSDRFPPRVSPHNAPPTPTPSHSLALTTHLPCPP